MEDAICPQKLDRNEFAAKLAVRNRKSIRVLKVVCITLILLLSLWLYLFCYGNTFWGILLAVVILFALLQLQSKCRIYCPRCGFTQDGRLNWHRDKQSPVEPHELLAHGNCGYCRAELFTTPSKRNLQLKLTQLQGGRSTFLANDAIFISILLGLSGLFLCTIFTMQTITLPLLAIAVAATFFTVICCLLWLRQAFSPQEAPKLPCPECGEDLNRYNYRRAARETGGCGYCGARIVADFIPEPVPPVATLEERRQILDKRVKDGQKTITAGICMLAGGILFAALLLISSPYWDSLGIPQELKALYLAALGFGASGIVSIVLGKKQKTGFETVLTRGGVIQLKPGGILLDHFPDDEACAQMLEKWKRRHRPSPKKRPVSVWVNLGKAALLSGAMFACGIVIALLGGDKEKFRILIGGGLLGAICIPVAAVIALSRQFTRK